MLFDDRVVERQHLPLIAEGSVGYALLACMRSSCSLVRAIHEKRGADPNVRVRIVSAIGVRILNTIGATSLLTGRGYWSPAIHGLRDLREIGQLLEFFGHRPDDIIRWYESVGQTRNRLFGFREIERQLEAIRGPWVGWREGFSAYSNMGSHVGRESLDLLFDREDIAPGPFQDDDRFRRVLIALADEAVLSTLHLIRTMDVVTAPETVAARNQMAHAAVQGARMFLLESGDLIDYWK